MTWVQGGGFPQRNGEKEERRDGETLCPRELIPARGAVRHPLANSGLVCLEKALRNKTTAFPLTFGKKKAIKQRSGSLALCNFVFHGEEKH